MRWILVPGTELRSVVRTFVAWVDRVRGFPRTHAEEELTRVGPTPPGGWPTVTTTTQLDIRIHDNTGPAQLHGAIAISADPVVIRMVQVRQYDDGAGKRPLSQVLSDRGWVLRDDLPGTGLDPDPWTRLPARDGAAGSDDGVPIPEGEE